MFLKLFQVVIVITHGDIFKLVTLVLGASRLLAMAKDTSGFCLIIVRKVFFQLINCSIILQLQGPFKKHVSPHQFRISTPRGYEAIIFSI
jgi:hypothetical protein